jgi:hypothetical protein
MEILVLHLQFPDREVQLRLIRVWVEPGEEALPAQVEQVVLIMVVTGAMQQVTEPAEEEVPGMLLPQVQVMAVMAVILTQALQVRVHYLEGPVVLSGQEMDPEMPVMHRVVAVAGAVSLYLMVRNPAEQVLLER